MTLPDFLREADGEIRFQGSRIGLYHVVASYLDGEPAEAISLRYPDLGLAVIHKTIAFYLDHRKDITAYILAYDAKLSEQRKVGNVVSLAELRERLAAASGA